MAFTRLTYTYTGTNVFAVNFALGYLEEAHVTGRVNDEVDGGSNPVYRALTFITEGTVSLGGAALVSGDTVVLERTIPKTELTHDFADGAVINAGNLDNSHKQALMVAMEALDGRIATFEKDLDMGNNKIINLADGVSPQDAATFSQIGDAPSYAIAAAASAVAALASEGSASTSEGNSATSEANAAASATAATEALDSAFFRDVKSLAFADSPYTVLEADNGNFFSVDTSGGIVVINLPTIAGVSDPFNLRIKKETGDSNKITINVAGTDEFTGGATVKDVISVGGLDLTKDTDTTPDSWKYAQFGASIGDTTVDEFTDGVGYVSGTSTTLTLTTAIASENQGVLTFDGLTQHHAKWSVSGTTLTLSGGAVVPLGTDNIEFRYGSSLSIGAPADNTVSTAKLVDASVTFPKLSSAAIASQAEAEAGTATDKLMTPAQTKQAVTALAPTQSLLHVQDRKSSGTAGQSTSAGVTAVRNLNTVLTNEIAGASLASNQITLPAGTYYIDASTSGYGAIFRHRATLYNVTAASVALVGGNAYTDQGSSDASTTLSWVNGRITLGVTSVLELRHYAEGTGATGGGVAINDGNVEIYTDVKVLTV